MNRSNARENGATLSSTEGPVSAAQSQAGNSSKDVSDDTGTTSKKSNAVSSTLASWVAPALISSTITDNQPSQRATSIPDPAGATPRNNDTISSEDGTRPSFPSSSRRQPSSTTLSALLEPFNPSSSSVSSNDQENGTPTTATGRIKIPATSRAGADIAEQKTVNSVGLLESWKYIPFLAHQASKLASAFVSHHVFGPPKKSWGIELTLFTTAIRESVQYSHLSSLPTLRRFLNLGQILPVPKDGVVTPVTFQIHRRNLPGILAEFDDKEDGTRELTGEWVVSKRIWRRMQREHYGHANPASRPNNVSPLTPRRKSSSSSSTKARNPMSFRDAPTPATSSSSSRPQARNSSSASSDPSTVGKDKVILYLHGGAYYTMSAATHRYITISVSKYTNCRVFAVNYRLAPECRWPGQIHDAVQAYLRLIQDLKIPPEIIILMGDSAGGGLTLATIMYLRDHGFPLPCGAIVMSPWVDLTMSCDSWETNAPYDYLRMPSGDDHMNPIASLLGASKVKDLITHPYVSPLFGDFHDFPPLLIQCGDAECLRDEGTLLAHKASLAGVQVYHEVYEDCPHVFQAMFFLEASKKAFRSHRNFVKRVLSPLSHSSNTTTSSSALKSAGEAGSHGEGNEDRDTRVDLSEMDQEVMSDAHNVKADGQAEVAPLPASPRALRRELSSLTPLHATETTNSSLQTSGRDSNTGASATSRTDTEISEVIPDVQPEFLEEEGDLGYDDEEEEDDSNPFNIESSGASATASELDSNSIADENVFEQLAPASMDNELKRDKNADMAEDHQPDEPAANMAMNVTAGMVRLGSMMSNTQHHDLDSVAEEQDESIEKMEMEEDDKDADSYTQARTPQISLSRNTSSHRLHGNSLYTSDNHHSNHNYHQYRKSTSLSSTPSHSPSASFTSLPHPSPSGSHTPLASRTPTSSAPPSPGTSMRISNRQRSLSSLSMASMTSSNNTNLKRNSSSAHTEASISNNQQQTRPGHSRSNSSISIRTMRQGHFREMSKPRARANSHPDLQALLDSYDNAGPAQHTVLWTNEEDDQHREDPSTQVDVIAKSRKDSIHSSDSESMDDGTFDT